MKIINIRIISYLVIFINCQLNNVYFNYNNSNSNSNRFSSKYNLLTNINKSNVYSSYLRNIINYNNKRFLNELNEKCKTIDYNNLLCFECNIQAGYYPIYNDYNYDNRKNLLKKYIKNSMDCYNENTKPIGYYLNKHLQAYEKCYDSCKTCYGTGNRIFHNCSSCLNNYTFQPEIPYTTNCVPKCQYYYYYSFIGNYECTQNYHCPDKINLVVEKENKCLSDCKYDNIYIYQYNGECLKQCPNNTSSNSLNICLDSDIQKCTITIKNSIINGKSLNNIIVDEMAKNYAEEYSYTQNHISQFKIDNYSIIFVKNISCLQEFQLTFSHIDFNDTYDKIIDYYNFTSYPILGIIDNIDFMSNLITKYVFYDPNNGLNLNTSFCINSSIIIKKNISMILESGKFDWLLEQNIDIFNISSNFYINMCFHFKSHNGKDVILKDRILNYFPNISLCDNGCDSLGVNYDTQIVICKCNFTNFLTYFNEISEDLIIYYYNKVIKLILELSNFYENKIFLLWCNDKLFNYKYFFKNIGGIISILLIIVQIICTILFCINGFDNINKYIFYVSESYIKLTSINNNNSLNSSIKEIKEDLFSNNELYQTTILLSTKTFPITKSIKIFNDNENENIKKIKTKYFQDNSSLNIINKNKNCFNSLITKQESLNTNDEIISVKSINNNRNFAKISSNSNILINKDKYLEKDIQKYVSMSPNEMEFYEIRELDKRHFCEFYWDRIKHKQIIIKTFVFKEETIPRELKIILFIIYIDLFFTVSLNFFDNDYISEIFYSTDNMNFFEYFKKSFSYIATSIILITLITYFMQFFFYDKKFIRYELKKKKDDVIKLKLKIIRIIKSIKRSYIAFIIISYILSIFSWYYVACFNDVYPNIKNHWIQLTINIIIVMQIITLILPFLEACLRFLAIKCNSEKIYKLSTYINLD